MAAAVALLVGCGGGAPGPVTVSPAPSAKAAVAAVCARLLPALPDKVDKAERRPVNPAGAAAAAWGADPVVVLRCGVAEPRELTRTSDLTGVNDVAWFLVERPGTRVFTTVGRVANVEVSIPLEYEPAPGPLVDVAAAMKATNPELAKS